MEFDKEKPLGEKKVIEMVDNFDSILPCSPLPESLYRDLHKNDTVQQSHADSHNFTRQNLMQPSEYEKNELQDHTIKSKFSFILTREFLKILFLGQFLSLCISIAIIIITALAVDYKLNLPATQGLFLYFGCATIFTPITISKNGWKIYFKILKSFGWKSFIDVQANYTGIKAYIYTSVLSTILLDAWAIPVCVILSLAFLKVGYHWSQYLGIGICLAGIGFLIQEDMNSASDPIRGDIYCIISATFYAISNVMEEYLVRTRPWYEVLGQMGFWGTFISLIQIFVLERQELITTEWNWQNASLLAAVAIMMIIIYIGIPILFKLSSATFFNLSFLTSDFYSLAFSLILFHVVMHPLYPLAATCTLLGLVIFYIYPASPPEMKMIKDGDTFVNDADNISDTSDLKTTSSKEILQKELNIEMNNVEFDNTKHLKVRFSEEIVDQDNIRISEVEIVVVKESN
ncbi:17924_t:CDS:2, partial [Acaulospora morrowiae]